MAECHVQLQCSGDWTVLIFAVSLFNIHFCWNSIFPVKKASTKKTDWYFSGHSHFQEVEINSLCTEPELLLSTKVLNRSSILLCPRESKLCQVCPSSVVHHFRWVLGLVLGLTVSTDRLYTEQGHKIGYFSLGENSPTWFSTLLLVDRANKKRGN